MTDSIMSDNATSQSSALSSLSVEVFDEIVSHAPQSDRIALSQTCRSLRFGGITEPFLYAEPLSRADFPLSRQQTDEFNKSGLRYLNGAYGFAASLSRTKENWDDYMS